MNKTTLKTVGLLAIVVILWVTVGCNGRTVRVGSLQTDSQTVELGSANSVDVEIEMGSGELDVSGGASDLLQADFTYNVAELEPEVAYDDGNLTVHTPSLNTGIASLWSLDEYRYEWDLRLNEDVPMEMRVKLGAGRSDLDLGTLSLTQLDVEAGAGAVTVSLAGSTPLTQLNVEAGVGEITVDLTGDWQDDLAADLQAGVGEFTLLLPKDVGVRVDVDGGLSNTNNNGLTRDGDAYVNDAYGQSEVTLRINLQAGIGNINLELGD